MSGRYDRPLTPEQIAAVNDETSTSVTFRNWTKDSGSERNSSNPMPWLQWLGGRNRSWETRCWASSRSADVRP